MITRRAGKNNGDNRHFVLRVRVAVSEAKTEIMCLQTRGGGEVSFTINAAGQVYKQTIKVRVLGRGYDRRQIPPHRNNAAYSEGVGVLTAVKDGNL